jgi:hypothetical protein
LRRRCQVSAVAELTADLVARRRQVNEVKDRITDALNATRAAGSSEKKERKQALVLVLTLTLATLASRVGQSKRASCLAAARRC